MHFNEQGRIDCEKCHGDRLIRSRPPDLVEVCPVCHGSGGCDWIEYAMGRRAEHSHQMMFNAAHRNIQTLIHLIYEEGRKIGEQIEVKLERRPTEDLYKTRPSILLRR